MRRGDIAVAIAQRQTEVEERQAKVLKVANEMTQKQKDVAQRQKTVTSQQENLAQKEAEISREEAEIAKEQAEVSCEEAELAKKQAEISREEAELAKKQEEISREEAELAKEQEEIAYVQEGIAQEQGKITQEQSEITKEQEKIVREQAEILKVNGTITELAAVDAGLQTDVLTTLDHLDEYGALKPILLEFDNTCQTIRWGKNSSIQLTKSQYDMVKILYHAPACQMSTLSLEDKVWGKDSMPTTAAVKMAVSRLNNQLRARNFPFEVIRIQRDLKTVPVINPITRKVEVDFAVQPEIEMYELVRK